ncbi:hypothetical protein GCM10022419_018550 [Nonomuraea rosea]|uniref:Uncharacterized protein n=1 Tax=Nonomuraea rosea TaxID=638574 RepID=A0ABP6VQ65_9ACTN
MSGREMPIFTGPCCCPGEATPGSSVFAQAVSPSAHIEMIARPFRTLAIEETPVRRGAAKALS